MFEDADDLAVDRHLLVTQRLRARRLQLGLTQKQVVTRLARRGVRTTNKTLSSFEHGAGVDVCRLPDLARALDCTVTYLLGLTSHPAQWEPDDHQADDRARSAQAAPIVGPMRSGDRRTTDAHFILGPEIPARRTRG
jgi:transcriptional regulator with XRE-family HTH domain